MDVKGCSSICPSSLLSKSSTSTTLGTADYEESHWCNAVQYRHIPQSGDADVIFRPFVFEKPYAGFGKMAISCLNDLAASWVNATMPNVSDAARHSAIARRSSLYLTIISCSIRRSLAVDILNAASFHDMDSTDNWFNDSGEALDSEVTAVAATSFQRRGHLARHDD